MVLVVCASVHSHDSHTRESKSAFHIHAALPGEQCGEGVAIPTTLML